MAPHAGPESAEVTPEKFLPASSLSPAVMMMPEMFKFRLISKLLITNQERSKQYTSIVLKQLRLLSVKASVSNGALQPADVHRKSLGGETAGPDPVIARRKSESSKQILRRIFNLVQSKSGNRKFDLKYDTARITSVGSSCNMTDPMWKSQIRINWPEYAVFEGTGRKKVDAETNAATRAFQSLKVSGCVNDANDPVFPEVVSPDGQGGIYSGARASLGSIFAILRKHIDADHKHDYKTTEILNGCTFSHWETTLSLTWPKPLQFTAIGSKKKYSENAAAHKALKHLGELGALYDDNTPVVHKESEIKTFLESQRSVPRLDVNDDLMKQIDSVVQEIGSLNLCSERTSLCLAQDCDSVKDRDSTKDCGSADDYLDWDSTNVTAFDREDIKLLSRARNGTIIDIFSGYPLSVPRERALELRNLQLHNNLTRSRGSSHHAEAKDRLPITAKRQQILDLIRNHPVVVIVGETGCGKTTQLPQFILDDFAEKMQGSSCNMIVTQPRRIAAVSIARRVAEERGEQLGNTVGYRIRLDGVVPAKRGRILFCSTGDFIRRLLNNPGLTGVSHVVVDEVHERNVLIDFLLIILRDIVSRQINPDLRVVIMSATIDYQRLASYFNECPVCHIGGFLHPVAELFREDLGDLLQYPKINNFVDPFFFDANAVAKFILNVSANRPLDGAILCFLPGWQEITVVQRILTENLSHEDSLWVLPIHSKLSKTEQARIFERPPPAIRKIVLATNIAETSITVDDVAYVVDCGIHREMIYAAKRNVSYLETVPISLANVKQRRGRAGRTRPGECFHLFPREALSRLAEFPTPEIQRTSLETVVINAKAYFPDCKALDFLAKALDPPPFEAVVSAVWYLKDLGILDDAEQLTPLGRLVLPFPIHPRLAKALVYAAAFGCVEPVLSLVAILSNNRDIFLDDQNGAVDLKKQVKMWFAKSSENSDHLVSIDLFDTYLEMMKRHETARAKEYCDSYGLNKDALFFIKGVRGQLKCQLLQMITFDYNEAPSSDRILVKAVLAAAFYPNMVQLKKGSVTQARIVSDSTIFLKLDGGVRVNLRGHSVNRMSPPVNNSWLTYFASARWRNQLRCETVGETSAVPLAAVLLFAGKRLSIRQNFQQRTRRVGYVESGTANEDHEVFLAIDNSQVLGCQCSMRMAQSLMGLRSSLECYLRWFFANASSSSFLHPPKEAGDIREVHLHLVNTIVRLLEADAGGRPS